MRRFFLKDKPGLVHEDGGRGEVKEVDKKRKLAVFEVWACNDCRGMIVHGLG